MPITGASSYVPTSQAFLSHWAEVNAALDAGSPLSIAGHLLGQPTPVLRATLEGFYTALLAKRNEVTAALVALDFARADVADLKTLLVQRIDEFIAAVRGNLGGTKYERALPAQPDADDTQETFQSASIRVQTIWSAIDAATGLGLDGPLVLQGDFIADAFDAVVLGIPGTFMELEKKRAAVKMEREERNDLQDKIYPVLKAYRQVMPGKFPPGHALADSLPRLSPLPGHTPDAVELTGAWDAPSSKAKLEWEASTDPDLYQYEVRGVPGDDYDSDDEVVIANIAKEGPLVFLTDQFLTESGQHASFKIYVILNTANESGSNAVTITRP